MMHSDDAGSRHGIRRVIVGVDAYCDDDDDDHFDDEDGLSPRLGGGTELRKMILCFLIFLWPASLALRFPTTPMYPITGEVREHVLDVLHYSERAAMNGSSNDDESMLQGVIKGLNSRVEDTLNRMID
ncbi:hypothetical protein FOZ63_006352 [Perkinsus olseni]|uniref:Uncharacterized protein n=1 Tax=Perkinsus olseni TaxID=32597 RepID=A0A7J6QHL7_PEROL|nr:hypothetical protein FOZ63_006352 [Perkinsus olseni]KAF4730269.1 hypothetical protein FOZ62_022892 [Perkinsus olseni]